jgi:hypothetical protein
MYGINNGMMKFITFFEKRNRNPLRKKQLEDEGRISNPEYIKSVENDLPEEDLKKIKRMKRLGVEPDKIESFKQSKLSLHQQALKRDLLRTKIGEKDKLVTTKYGIQVFKDSLAEGDFGNGSKNLHDLNKSLYNLKWAIYGLLPLRKPKIIITDLEKHPKSKGVDVQGTKAGTAGMYHDRIIYLDHKNIRDHSILVHEYAHYIADLIPKQYEEAIKDEYKKLIDSYFERVTKRKSMQGKWNKKHREAMAAKLGLPSVYSSVNFDEFFAELITHWRDVEKLPNNATSYRFKTIIKKVISRL